MKIVKNWLNKDLAWRVRNYLLSQPYTYNSNSHKLGKNTFFVSVFNVEKNKEIFDLGSQLIKHFDYNIKIIRAYANLQFSGMNGEWHTDDGDTTCLWMATKSLPKGSGEFKTKKQSVKFDFNKLVIFDANKPHKGMAPKELNTPRITLAFKTQRYD
jgi:hypothetical protein